MMTTYTDGVTYICTPENVDHLVNWILPMVLGFGLAFLFMGLNR